MVHLVCLCRDGLTIGHLCESHQSKALSVVSIGKLDAVGEIAVFICMCTMVIHKYIVCGGCVIEALCVMSPTASSSSRDMTHRALFTWHPRRGYRWMTLVIHMSVAPALTNRRTLVSWDSQGD
jgi:hypothetical protein